MRNDARRDKIEDLFRTHARGVGGYVLAHLGDAELAEAITSRVFLIVVRSIDQCKTQPTAWLWSIVRSELARHFRDRKNHAEIDESHPDPGAQPLEQASTREMQAKMRQALARLPEDQQKLVYMKFFQGLPNKEIAGATGLTASNVGVLIHRALKLLREYIEPLKEAVEGRT